MVEAVLSRVELSAARLALGRLLGHDLAVIYSLVVLALIGLVVSFSAGPVATARLGIDDPFFFTERHVVFLCGSASLAFATSLLSQTTARRLGILLAGLCVLLMVAALVIGPEIKGAHRWISFGRFNLQPSEFFKPAFVCAAAWFLSMERNDSGLNGSTAALVLYSVASILLIMQPDYGQWMLLTGIWMVMFFVAGWSWTWIFGLGTAALSALGFGYITQAHVRSRIDRFLNPSSGDTYQVDKASEAISSGGVFGHDLHEVPGVKASLP
ncbi:MAG: FtsW/RodA/SpoVE family cell cycle protein, partial [Pseudomonadota bacterium]